MARLRAQGKLRRKRAYPCRPFSGTSEQTGIRPGCEYVPVGAFRWAHSLPARRAASLGRIFITDRYMSSAKR